MPRPRKELVCLDATPFYHCVSRCVRRAFLCGDDPLSGKSFNHRRQWIEVRLLELANIFAIDVVAYAVMSNHYHVVVHVDREQALQWTPLEVVNRWHRLCKGCPLSQRFARGEAPHPTEQIVLDELIDTWRERLYSISRFMGTINQEIARASNLEDNCTGRFWEGRFKSDALLDEKALVACAVYVDLNPIRARMAVTPEQSDHTSVKKRSRRAKLATQPNHPNQQVPQLLPFVGNPGNDMPKGLPFRLTDYLELVEWTGRMIRQDKRGAIDTALPPILERLNIAPKQWLYTTTHFESQFKHLIGTALHVQAACQLMGKRWDRGMKACQTAFPT